MNYVVATIKSWNIKEFQQQKKKLPGQWILLTEPEKLTLEFLREVRPRYIFFPHWSWKVSEVIINEFECVCFHMTDLPFGRGGSPLQNLIILGIENTKLTALRMTKEIDAGPIYNKVSLSIEGSAQQIFERAAKLVYELIEQLVNYEVKAHEQAGDVVYFQRRMPEQSEVPSGLSDNQLYNFIRMLDADSYPRAFIKQNGLKYQLSQAEVNERGRICAQVEIIRE